MVLYRNSFQEAFSAGIGTSAVTITWTMTELIRKPQVMRKVQDEIRAVVGSNEMVQSHDVPKLNYLKMVVKETMRLHPPAPLLLPRETTQLVNIAGYDVPAHSRIYVNMWAIGRDLTSWPDNPQEFNPERFEAIDMDIYGVQPELMPFGSGRRICPGLFMALATMEFTLANMLYCFDWALLEGMLAEEVSMEEKGKVVVHLKTPLMLVPTAHIQKI
jgi:4-hydroxyphenylacetaldehyde oxime monooxygenase